MNNLFGSRRINGKELDGSLINEKGRKKIDKIIEKEIRKRLKCLKDIV